MDTNAFLAEHVTNNFHTIDFDMKMHANQEHRIKRTIHEAFNIEKLKHYG